VLPSESIPDRPSDKLDPLPRSISTASSVPADPSPITKATTPLGSVDSTAKRRDSDGIQRYSKEDFVPVGGPIGNGSYGQVRKVVHKRTAELFAMKEIPKKKIKDHKMEDYLHLEVKLQYKLRHQNILRLHYYFENAEMVYLLLEYAGGGSLFSYLRKKGKLPELEAAPIFVGVAKALNYMHRHNVVHRDLKPENILLCAGGVAKVADFGWSAEMKDGAPRHTFCGTWDYLSPEMVQNEPHDHTVDTWAVGVLLYEMITGRAPFAASSQMKALARITNVDLQIPDYVSTLARDLITKILVKDCWKRLCLEDAVRHEWARRFVRVDDEVSPNGVSNAALSRSPAVEAESPPATVERPVPKPKALSSSARPRSPLLEAPSAREEARALLPPEAAKALQDLRLGKPSGGGGVQPPVAEVKKSSIQASPLDDMHAPEPRELPTSASHASPLGVSIGELSTSASGLSSNRPVREIGFDGVATAPESQPKSYAETDTYKSIRNWVRKASRESNTLAEELDRTVHVEIDSKPSPLGFGSPMDDSSASRCARRASDPVVASSMAAYCFENSRGQDERREVKGARDISPIQRSWVASTPSAHDVAGSKLPSEARKPHLARDISPIACGRDIKNGYSSPMAGCHENRLFMDEGMLDDTYPTGAPDPRSLLNGALLNAGLIGAFGSDRDPVDAKA